MPEKVAILLDGGFVKKKLSKRNGHFATVQEVTSLCRDIMADDYLKTRELFRIYYYDAPLLREVLRIPFLAPASISRQRRKQPRTDLSLIPWSYNLISRSGAGPSFSLAGS